MSNEEKTPFGASITTTPSTPPPVLHKLETTPEENRTSTLGPLPSELSTTPIDSDATPRPSHDIDTTNPLSAFYSHRDLRRSFDGSRSNYSKDASKTNLNINIKDLEAQTPLSNATSRSQLSRTSPKVSVDGRVKECTVWPSKNTLREKAQLAKKRGPVGQRWAKLNKKQKLWVKIAIALFIIGAAVGIGVGVSKAVGGGVWSSQGNSHKIPDVNTGSSS